MSETLTQAEQDTAVAMIHATGSQVARVALFGRENGWPEAHVATAVKVVKETHAEKGIN